jgi:photosystem II stability/assembly factor-like uncharacterized protein
VIAFRAGLVIVTTAFFLMSDRVASPYLTARTLDTRAEIVEAAQKISGGFTTAKRFENGTLWAVGREGSVFDARSPSVIINSTDMGFTWTRKMLVPECCLLDIDFIGLQDGWAVGAGILHTTDGGKSWIRQYSSKPGSTMKMIRFINAQKGWAMGEGGEVLRTVDGGAHWAVSRLPSGWVNNEFKGWLTCVSFADDLNGWILGNGSQAYQTTDGGSSWHSRSSQLRRVLGSRSPAIPDFKEVRFFTRDVGFMIVEYLNVLESEASYVIRGSTLAVLKTENGGRQWVLHGELRTPPLIKAYLVSEQEWWLQTSSRKSLQHTVDSGKTWMQVKLPEDVSESVLLFVDSKTIWMLSHAAGFDGSNLLTRDGGQTWVRPKANYRTE